jgi:hypothetical protein
MEEGKYSNIFYNCKSLRDDFLPIPDTSTRPDLEYLIFISWIFFCTLQILEWLILIIISEVECTEVNTDTFPDPEISLEHHALEWISMYWSHEPPRLIGSDRDESIVESFTIALLDLLDKGSISSISCEVERLSIYLYSESSPERLIPIGESSRREVLSREEGNLRSRKAGRESLIFAYICSTSYLIFSILYFLPPVHIYCIFHTVFFEIVLIPESSIDRRMITRFELFESSYIHMIIVIM